MAAPDAVEIGRHIDNIAARLSRALEEDLRSANSALESVLRSVVFRDPASRVRTQAQRLDELSHRLRAGLVELLGRSRQRLEPASNRLAALHPARLVERAAARLERTEHRLAWALGGRSKHASEALAAVGARLLAAHPRHRAKLARQRVSSMARELEALSYRNVLRRGFSVTRSDGGEILRSVEQVSAGERIETELTDGKLRSTVDGGATAPGAKQPGGVEPKARKKKQTPRTGPSLFD